MGTRDNINDRMAGDFVFSPIVLLRALRPLQWVKNGLVILPFVFAVNLVWSTDDLGEVPGLVLVALAFCFLSSPVYLLSDLIDRSADRRHPVKWNRPIASGKVSVSAAATVMALLAAAGLAVMVVIEPLLGIASGLYALINSGYSLGLNRVVLLDAFAVTSGYVIRVAAGDVTIAEE